MLEHDLPVAVLKTIVLYCPSTGISFECHGGGVGGVRRHGTVGVLDGLTDRDRRGGGVAVDCRIAVRLHDRGDSVTASHPGRPLRKWPLVSRATMPARTDSTSWPKLDMSTGSLIPTRRTSAAHFSSYRCYPDFLPESAPLR